VLDVIRDCESVVGKPLSYEVRSKRAGDADILIADSSQAMICLSWIPLNADLTSIVQSAYLWNSS
jgi:UDP-glucose 4-epimerase